MNDEETETRHLFAVATADRPAGIDLLGGFAAARRRDRSRRARRGAGLLAGVTAAVAAAITITLTTGSTPPALATVTSALSSTLSQSYHLSQQTTYYVNGQLNHTAHGSCTVEADPARQLSQSHCSPPNNYTVRQVGGYTYYSNSTGDRWERVPDADLHPVPAGNLKNSFIAATPQQLLAELKQESATVTAAGSASGPGWTGTRYAFRGTVGKVTVLSGTVTVDQHGQTRVFVVTFRNPSNNVLVMTQVFTFSDYGAPVTVTAPPADQTSPMP
ncbi:MAG TPA: hypothetical protein VN847_18435 [Streptosporangiaceae bacterium]|nr:hypothetical protein [Streptosporangiaceae bacterium]